MHLARNVSGRRPPPIQAVVVGLLLVLAACSPQPGTASLAVILIPADGGTEDGTLADYEPLFESVARHTSLRFHLTVAQSYNAVVEAMCSGSAEVAFLGPVTYLQARERGCAELLAVGVENGQSIYYAGLFASKTSGLRSVADLRHKSVAFGDLNSASSFVFPLAMILDAGIDPIAELSAIRLTGSHANSLAALVHGHVDVAAASFDSYEKAVRQGAVKADAIRIIGKSIEIPYPPLAMRTSLPAALKAELKAAFGTIHQAEGIRPEMIRGYGGKQIDRYDTAFDPARFDVAARTMARIDDHLKEAIIAKASAR